MVSSSEKGDVESNFFDDLEFPDEFIYVKREVDGDGEIVYEEVETPVHILFETYEVVNLSKFVSDSGAYGMIVLDLDTYLGRKKEDGRIVSAPSLEGVLFYKVLNKNEVIFNWVEESFTYNFMDNTWFPSFLARQLRDRDHISFENGVDYVDEFLREKWINYGGLEALDNLTVWKRK